MSKETSGFFVPASKTCDLDKKLEKDLCSFETLHVFYAGGIKNEVSLNTLVDSVTFLFGLMYVTSQLQEKYQYQNTN